MAAAEALDRHPKAFAALAQPVDAMVELLRYLGRQPGAEGEHAPRHGRRRNEREVALEVGLIGGGAPGDR